MTTAETTPPFALAPPAPVDPAAIGRGLAEVWAGATRGETGDAIVRACTLNVAVIVPSARDLGVTSESVGALTLRHPCRLFVIAAADGDGAAVGMDAFASVLCHLAGAGQPHICSEQITITAGGDAVGALPHLLLSLLVPDLPFVVWWRGAVPAGGGLFNELAAIADRVVIDSAECGDAQAMATLAPLLRGARRPSLGDLAWSRLTRWRTLTAQCFDAPEQRPYLDRLDQVDVETGTPHVPSEALLWLGWLASRLQWRIRSSRADGTDRLYSFDAGRPIEARVRCLPGGSPAVLRRLALQASPPPAARFTLERSDSACVQARMESSVACLQRVMPFDVRDAVSLLSDELDLMGRDRIYEEALSVAIELARLLDA